MKLRTCAFTLFALFGIIQSVRCDDTGTGFDASLNRLQARWERAIDRKLSHADNKLQLTLENGLNKGFTNTTIKLGGMGVALLSCAYFLMPELVAYADASKTPANGQIIEPHIWNNKKIAMGLVSMIAGLAVAASGDRMTNYLYTPRS